MGNQIKSSVTLIGYNWSPLKTPDQINDRYEYKATGLMWLSPSVCSRITKMIMQRVWRTSGTSNFCSTTEIAMAAIGDILLFLFLQKKKHPPKDKASPPLPTCKHSLFLYDLLLNLNILHLTSSIKLWWHFFWLFFSFQVCTEWGWWINVVTWIA